MTTVVITTEEIVRREITVEIASFRSDPLEQAEALFWNGLYDSSKDIDRRDEKIISKEIRT